MYEKRLGVSPIIGLVVMVGDNVGIVALVADLVFDIGTEETRDRVKASSSLWFGSSAEKARLRPKFSEIRT